MKLIYGFLWIEPHEICSEDNFSNVVWKMTPAGETAAVRCPPNAMGELIPFIHIHFAMYKIKMSTGHLQVRLETHFAIEPLFHVSPIQGLSCAAVPWMKRASPTGRIPPIWNAFPMTIAAYKLWWESFLLNSWYDPKLLKNDISIQLSCNNKYILQESLAYV